MRCGSCAIGIELMLGKMKGVKNIKVSLNERIAIVDYGQTIANPSGMTKAVNDLGYIATVQPLK